MFRLIFLNAKTINLSTKTQKNKTNEKFFHKVKKSKDFNLESLYSDIKQNNKNVNDLRAK